MKEAEVGFLVGRVALFCAGIPKKERRENRAVEGMVSCLGPIPVRQS